MPNDWYSQDKKELNALIEILLQQRVKTNLKDINGIIVPHAGYFYSGRIAGQAYSLLQKNKKNKVAVILAPSHYIPLLKAVTPNTEKWQTPLGKIGIDNNDFPKMDISNEHAIDNQIPFLQKLRFKKILPIVVGEINLQQAKEIAKKLSKINAFFVISTDLSHFLKYEKCIKKDKKTIKTIKNLDLDMLLKEENSACGVYPLLVFFQLAKIKGWKPALIEYKNSGDITKDKEKVVGYASFSF
jgi:AmmeMemoRadiSam system protein B